MPEIIDLTLDSSPPPEIIPEPESREKKRSRKKQRRSKGEGEGEDDHTPVEGKKRRESSRKERHRSKGEDGADGQSRGDSNRQRDSPADPEKRRTRRKKERDTDPATPLQGDLFFIDVSPSALPTAARYSDAVHEEAGEGLILPPHVSVFGTEPAKILPSTAPDSDEEDYIEFLDYDSRKDFVRYYDTGEKRSKIVCKRCGAEDEHTTAACNVLICLTCGARDEHPTRSCPIGKICFNCGMKGHINADCPNSSQMRSRGTGCERCNSSAHQTSECPTLWRLYDYVDDAEQGRILGARQDKKQLPLGQGGEGYIANDEWCYNCGGSGHWGDDCREIYHLETLVEPSAFSHQVLASGPFPLPENSNEPRAPREWEREIVLPGGQAHVGRHARQKAMEKLSRRAQQQEAEEPGDWFTTTQTRSDRDYHRERASGSSNVPTAPRKMVFGTLDAAARPFQFSAPSSSKALPLAQRLSYDRPHDSRSSRSRSGHERSSDSHTHNRHRDDHRERDQDRYTRRDERGPRYRGGYR